ncbi:TonB family protein [Aquincola sp. S2]|uniref:TonB family protein n=1 Tax=Pseudaquabacterium terrae TaxID=2732868 RepID=A0ABX2EPH6_9BURK|nr:energy transducer TonB [Aquabacterium terrae]NRF70518.1 TonB family protein [Aquabacterium terrae]
MRKLILATAGLCCCISLASAQTTIDAATKERMERAKRDAANPLRIIIEAAQVKRTKASETAAPAPAAAAAPAPAPTPVPAPVAARPPAPTTAARPSRSEPATAATTPAKSEPAPTPAPIVEPTPEPAVAAAPASAAPAPVEASIAAPSQQLASASPRATPPVVDVPLKLVRYIEPEIPSRIRARLKPNNEVTVVLQVNPDGSVSGADIRATTSRALDTLVLDAVRQWRYDPVPTPREHTVQLVFNLSD